MVGTSSAPFERMRPGNEYEKIVEQRAADGVAFFTAHNFDFVDVDCPACGGRDLSFSFKKYGFSHRRCATCATFFVSPRPTADRLGEFYNTYPSPKLWTEFLLAGDMDRKIVQYRPRVELIVAHCRSLGMPPGGIALDIGAGSGAFAVSLRETGFFKEVFAHELSQDCADKCRRAGLKVITSSLESTPAHFDLITTNDLIEHVFDPPTLLRDIFFALKPNGVASIATPNGLGFDFFITGDSTRNICPPEHINYFNPASLQMALQRARFRNIEVTTPGALDTAIIQKELANGLPAERLGSFLAYVFSERPDALPALQEFLAKNRLSSHMLALAQK